MGSFRRPETWASNRISEGKGLALPTFQVDLLFTTTSNSHRRLPFSVRIVHHFHSNINHGFLSRHFRRGDKDAILCNVHLRHGQHPHMAVNAGATVPTAVGLGTVVHLHHNFVHLLLAIVQKFGYINRERSIAIVMLSCLLTVDEHLCMLIDPFEKQLHHFTFRCGKRLTVFAIATGPAKMSQSCGKSTFTLFPF